MKQDYPNGKSGSGSQPQPRREFDLDHVNLHSDVSVDRFQDQAKKKTKKKPKQKKPGSRVKELFFSAFLNMVLAGGFGFLMWERQENATLHQSEMKMMQQQATEQSEQIQEATNQINALSGNNKELKTKGETLSVNQQNLNSTVAKERAKSEKYKSEMSKLKKSSAKLEKNLKAQKKNVKSLKSKLALREKALKGQISTLEANFSKKEQEHQTVLVQIESKLSALTNERNQLNTTVNRYKNQISEEAEAGKASMVQQGKLVDEKRALQKKVNTFDKERKRLQAKIKDLEEVTTGELVPFSTDITLPVPHYKEPFPKALRWPRGEDVIVVHMLINESGSVKEIYYPQGQYVDNVFKSVMSPILFKWKFSPPKYGALSVQAWIPVIIRKP